MTFKVRFWGVRGSIASPGPETQHVGGNTSSLEIRAGDTRLLLDAGTGLRRLGEALLREGVDDITLLLSHLHWDHIQGLPFFVPLYQPQTRLHVLGQRGEHLGLAEVLAQQMSSPVFPVRFAELASRVTTTELNHGSCFDVGPLRITVAKLNHPGGVLGYRIEHQGRTIVYATDTEHYCCPDPALIKLSENADLLIYDAQYTPEEYRGELGPAKVGWGHSTYESGVEVSRLAGVKQLVLFHHDPKRSDAAVLEIENRARELFPNTIAAREGMELAVGESEARAA